MTQKTTNNRPCTVRHCSVDSKCLQRRIARFGLSGAALAIVTFLVAAALATMAGGWQAVLQPSFAFHVGAGLSLGAIWLVARGPVLPTRWLLLAEGLGFASATAFVTLIAAVKDLDQNPVMFLVLALTYLLVLRATLVPAEPRQTLILGLVVGAPALGFAFWSAPSEPWMGTAWTTMYWSMSMGVATLISKVVYGLRQDASDARRMGAYTLEELIGKGGMGEVWRGTHRLLRRPAAIKLIGPEVLGSGLQQAEAEQRFQREAETTALLESPHTVQLYDFGISDSGEFYHVIELLNGINLQSLIEDYGPLPAERVVFLLLQILDSLDDAHAHGLVHRDIKPANIFLSRRGRRHDFVKVLDFGLAQPSGLERGRAWSRTSESVSGTPAYLAPEVLVGENDAGVGADLYALGCVAYWLLTSRLVFERRNVLGMTYAHVNTAPVPPSLVAELEIPAEVESLVLSCLAKDPTDRPQSAQELASALQEIALRRPWNEQRAITWWHAHLPEHVATPTLTATRAWSAVGGVEAACG